MHVRLLRAQSTSDQAQVHPTNGNYSLLPTTSGAETNDTSNKRLNCMPTTWAQINNASRSTIAYVR